MKSGMHRKGILFLENSRWLSVLVYGTLAIFFFVLIYGYTNARASALSSHYAMYAPWEEAIPLVPWMVYPYLSLNLLFLLSIFIVSKPREIRAFCLCLCAGAAIAGIVFFLFPGKIGFPRFSQAGEYADLYSQIYALDHPHNLYPSLHVTYSALAVWVMGRELRSNEIRALLWIWFALICASVVFTHQHHVFDVVSGSILAIFLIRGFYPLFVGQGR